MTEPGSGFLFLRHSSHFLENDFLPRIERAVHSLSEEQVWWRPNASSNSIANLMLHLSGNVRQWIISGVGGEPDSRQRDREFSARGGIMKEAIAKELRSTVETAVSVIRSIDVHTLAEQRRIQGNTVTVLEAVYHVVEHFSMHTGQILYIAKLMTDNDLRMYTFPGGEARKNW